MNKGTRGALLDRLAGAIESVSTSHPLRVAVDGPPAAGKTTLADELALLFLLRPELIDRWDLSIFVSAPFEQMVARARIRDLALLGSTAEVERRFRTRYIPAQELYFAAARPADHADIIVHNDEPRRPAWEIRPH
jgi:uridine kinase